jgi:hypothetical protein
MAEEQQGLDDAAIEQESAVALPEREAMSLVDGGVKLVPIPPLVIPTPNHPSIRSPRIQRGRRLRVPRKH